MAVINIKKLNPLSAIASRELVGIELRSQYLTVAHARASISKREVVNLLKRDINNSSDDDISRIISSSVKELKAKDPYIINVIPSHLSITKNIEIPSTDAREIKEIINLQAGRHTPYSREEIIIGYIEIGTYKNSYTKILLVIVARNIVKRHYEILDKAGLKLESVLFAPEGLAWSASKLFKLETQDAPLSLIHIDEAFTDFTVIFRNKPIFIRSISIGAKALAAERERYQPNFIEELKKSLEAYQNEDIEKSPWLIILSGAVEEIKNMESALSDALRFPVRIMPYYINSSVSGEAFKAASVEKQMSFLNVLTPLLAWGELKVDLTPEEIKLRKALEERGKDLIKTGVFVLTTIVLFFFILLSKIYFKSAYLKNLSARYKSLGEEAMELEKDFTKVSQIRRYLESRGVTLEVLAELHRIIPDNLELEDIRLEDQGKFSVKGTADSMSTVFSFVDAMEKSKYFKDAKTKHTTKRKEGTIDVTDFEITSLLEKQTS